MATLVKQSSRVPFRPLEQDATDTPKLREYLIYVRRLPNEWLPEFASPWL
jgi:hypothetical protein